MKRPAWLLLTILLWTDSIECFQGMALLPRRSVSESRSLWSLSARRRRESLDDEEGGEVEASTTGIPQLPAFGGSSFSNSMDMKNPGASFVRTDENHLTDAAFASPKFKLQYTCNVCDTRNSHMVSRLGKIKISFFAAGHSLGGVPRIQCVLRRKNALIFFSLSPATTPDFSSVSEGSRHCDL